MSTNQEQSTGTTEPTTAATSGETPAGTRPKRRNRVSVEMPPPVAPLPGQIAKADRIMATVADHFGLTVKQLRSRSRVRSISHPRAVACWLLRRRVPGISYPEIGRKLGGFDHSSVMYGHRLVQKCPRLREEADSIATKIVAVYAREHTTKGANL